MAMYDVAQLREFYFVAAAATYAGGVVKKETIPDLPHSKVYRYKSDDLLYVDTFFTNGEYSGGQTIICVEGVPAWLMQYCGWCKDDNKEVLAFLKKALLDSYMRKEFNGGRGPAMLDDNQEGGLVYQNWSVLPPYNQNFANFQGRERIWRKPVPTEDVFWHRYQGLLLGLGKPE